MSAIETRGLTKSFGPRVALAGIDLVTQPGEFLFLVGPNGAGKTTLLRILATLTRPTSGAVMVSGLDVARDGDKVRREIGFLSHRPLLYEDLTAEQNLRFYARMYDLEEPRSRIHDLLERTGLIGRRHDLVRTLSRGMQQRLALARAVLHRPSVLLLDEPYTGLDPVACQALTDLLAELAGSGCTILLATHDLARGLELGGRMVMLVQGRVVHDAAVVGADPDALAERYRRLTA